MPREQFQEWTKTFLDSSNQTRNFGKIAHLIHALINNGDALYGDIAVICRGWGKSHSYL
ncbi:MAG: hypothetical protein Ct9H300mP18_09170 [Candidatus Neomarinimicrobiota bacterium]|nr:MAG: hypothetical protein Ct9H300mP18_09170 [Candidatus Neomarinimicrobiota bacterium]